MNSSAPTLTNELDVTISDVIRYHLGLGRAVALWRLPQQSKIQVAICTQGLVVPNDFVLETSEQGFLMAPFHPQGQKYFLAADHLFVFEKNKLIKASKVTELDLGNLLKNNETPSSREQISFHAAPYAPVHQPEYQQLVRKSIEFIEKGVFEKIVPARSKDVELYKPIDPLHLFESLCTKYPHAFVSLVSSTETGTWVGATPEVLVSVSEDQIFKTVALAGTKFFTEGMNLKSVAWTQKEIEEQAMVSRYIINCLKKLRVREYTEHGPRTSVAGNLVHLKTDYEVDMKAISFPQFATHMLKLLHPTSAVCGMPLEESLAFLTSQESFDRAFYTGYLGPVGLSEGSHLYVNLRCIQMFEKVIRFYAGAGVTADSDPETEWHETEMKMNTMASVVFHSL